MNEKRKQLTLKIGEMSVLITMSSGCGVKWKKSKKNKNKENDNKLCAIIWI